MKLLVDANKPGALAELELRSHFVGRRGGCRIQAEFRVGVQTEANDFVAQAIDVSRTGILLEIMDNVYGGEDLAAFAAAVEQHFGGTTRILLSQLQLEIRASLIRVMAHDGRLRIAFRFDRLLSLPACDLLGLPLGADRDQEAGS